jgi:structural maintenance of chromosomes protein 6
MPCDRTMPPAADSEEGMQVLEEEEMDVAEQEEEAPRGRGSKSGGRKRGKGREDTEERPAKKRQSDASSSSEEARGGAEGSGSAREDDDEEEDDEEEEEEEEDDDDDDGNMGGLEDDEDIVRLDPRSAVNMPGRTAETGVIVKIYCENFMCHRKLSVTLCPNVNFINGQNGSGKSAILAALQICLGARANVTHRGSKLSDLIRQGHSGCVRWEIGGR